MLLKMFTYFNTRIAVLIVMLLVLGPLMSAAERTAIKADPCGPMMALQNAGKSVNLLPLLQHKDGSPLTSNQYRTAPDAEFYLPADAVPDAAGTTAALRGELDKFGAPPKGGCAVAKGPTCEDKLAAANAQIDKLNAALDKATNTINGLRDRVDAAERNGKGKISWWWLLFPLLAAVVLGCLYFYERSLRDGLENAITEQVAEVKRLSQELTAAYAAKAAQAKQIKAMLQDNSDLAEQNMVMDRNWRDLDALRKRVVELEALAAGQRLPAGPTF